MAAFLGAAVLAAIAAPGGVAAADGLGQVTTTAFTSSTAVQTGFGGDWSVAIHVETPGGPIGTEDGTVDVTVAGLPGNYASALPISGDGDVYLSPPDGKPSLGAGTHQLTAFFRPATGSGLLPSHSTKAAAIDVVALSADAAISVIGRASTSPVLDLALTGTWIDTTKTTPPGSWTVVVTGPATKPVYRTTVAQATASTRPIRVPIPVKLQRGTDYSFAARFVPTSAVAHGVTLSQARAVKIHTPDLTVSEALSQPVTVPPFATILALLVLIGLAVAVALLAVRLARRRNDAGSEAHEPEPDEATL
jgi:hypothetical protein